VHDHAPENSLASIDAALVAGCDGIEVDVHATRDGAIVVHHDPFVLIRHPDGSPADRRPIGGLVFDELMQFRLTDGSSIPTLESVLLITSGRAHLYVEIKERGIEQEVVGCVAGHNSDASVHSFDHRIILRCSEIAPAVRRGILLESYLVDSVAALRNARAHDFWQRYELIDRELVKTIQNEGGRVIAWTVDDGDAALEMARLGVDAICTDNVAALRAAFGRQ
jgi:glycerophosphoryl diester phosphodiesterase